MAVQQQQHQQFPAWAERYRRQVRSLPQGVAALHKLLHSVEHLLQKAEHCGSHSGVMKAYLGLGLVDLTSQAWQQRMAQLQEQQSKVRDAQTHARGATAALPPDSGLLCAGGGGCGVSALWAVVQLNSTTPGSQPACCRLPLLLNLVFPCGRCLPSCTSSSC